MGGLQTFNSTSLALRAFYRAKPLIPRRAQVAARRMRARRIWDQLGRNAIGGLPSAPLGYPWPHGEGACLLLTHDVETDAGQRNADALLAIEAAYGLKSCWNFVVRRYPVDANLISRLRTAGHEIGIHGVHHDGREFESEDEFRGRLGVMEQAAEAWGATGFRSPSLMYDLGMLRTLPFAWDSSMPAWDPFQPKPGDCHKYLPFRLSDRCLELPVTLWQDFTLFEELRMDHIGVWRRQIDAIYEAGGLINVIVHPDYMLTHHRLGLYRDLLEHLRSKQHLWITTPSEVVAWERTRMLSRAPSATAAQEES